MQTEKLRENSELVSAARALAYDRHANQLRRYTNAPYTTHLEDVAQRVDKYLKADVAVAVAYLHDLLEDTDTKANDPVFGQSDLHRCLRHVVILTNDHDKDLSRYEKWTHNYRRLARATSPIAQTVKVCDCMSNLSDIMQHDRKYGIRYLAEKFVLIRALLCANVQALIDAHMMISDNVEQLTLEERKTFYEYVGIYSMYAVSTELTEYAATE